MVHCGRCVIGTSVRHERRTLSVARVMLTGMEPEHGLADTCRHLAYHSAGGDDGFPSPARPLLPGDALVTLGDDDTNGAHDAEGGHEACINIDRRLKFRRAMFRCRYLFRAGDQQLLRAAAPKLARWRKSHVRTIRVGKLGGNAARWFETRVFQADGRVTVADIGL